MAHNLTIASTFTATITAPDSGDAASTRASSLEGMAQAIANRTLWLKNNKAQLSTTNQFTALQTFNQKLNVPNGFFYLDPSYTVVRSVTKACPVSVVIGTPAATSVVFDVINSNGSLVLAGVGAGSALVNVSVPDGCFVTGCRVLITQPSLAAAPSIALGILVPSYTHGSVSPLFVSQISAFSTCPVVSPTVPVAYQLPVTAPQTVNRGTSNLIFQVAFPATTGAVVYGLSITYNDDGPTHMVD